MNVDFLSENIFNIGCSSKCYNYFGNWSQMMFFELGKIIALFDLNQLAEEKEGRRKWNGFPDSPEKRDSNRK